MYICIYGTSNSVPSVSTDVCGSVTQGVRVLFQRATTATATATATVHEPRRAPSRQETDEVSRCWQDEIHDPILTTQTNHNNVLLSTFSGVYHYITQSEHVTAIYSSSNNQQLRHDASPPCISCTPDTKDFDSPAGL